MLSPARNYILWLAFKRPGSVLQRMDYDVASTEAVDSVVPGEYGGMWFFREPLDCENLGMTLLELEPGGKGKAHDHAADGQEEVYLVVGSEPPRGSEAPSGEDDEPRGGELTVRLGGGEDDPPDEAVTLGAGEAVRVGPETRRQLHNHGDERVSIVIAGAP
jgi:quercetin dioxygenase-like cupin family protein